MHRSGTSAVAGELDNLGIYGGKSLMEAAYDNPKGFYENTYINDINSEILEYNNSHWADIGSASLTWDESHIAKAKLSIKQQYRKASDIYLKDPQISLLLPFWIDVLSQLGYRICHLFVIRHPSEIVSSLARRNNFHPEKSKVLIRKYWSLALQLLSKATFAIIDYGELLEDPKIVIRKLKDEFRWTPSDAIMSSNHVSQDLQNNISNDIDIANHSEYLNRLYQQIKNYESGDISSLNKLTESITNASSADIKKIKSITHLEFNFAKLFLDSGHGYNEKESFLIQHDGLQLLYKFQFENTRIISIRLIPTHTHSLLSINKLLLHHNGEVIKYELQNNGKRQGDDKYLFVNSLPAFDITFDTYVLIDTLELEMNFLDVSKGHTPNMDSAKVVKSKAGLLLHSIILFFSQPFDFLKHINGQNMRTLRSALRRENPQTIYRNIKKLIHSYDSQVTHWDSSQRTDSEMSSTSKKQTNSNIIIYICGELPEYDKSSGAQRAEKILSILSESVRLIILYNKVNHSKYIEYYTNKGIALHPITSVKKLYKSIANNVVSVIFNKYYSFQDYNSILKYFPYSTTVIDAEDVAWVREVRSVDYTDLTEMDISRNRRNEIETYNAADQLWCVTQSDSDAIKKELPTARINIVSNIHRHTPHIEFKPSESNSILFFANYDHEPNISALKELVDVIFPLVLMDIPTATLIIAGSAIDKVNDLIPENPNINVLGYIEHNAIPQLYESASMIIAPLKFGSGIKGKVTESIMYKVPVITNAIGNEGINLIDKESGFVTQDSKVMAKYAVDIYNQKYDLKRITDNAYEKLEPLISFDNNSKNILESLFTKVSICIVTYNQLDLLRSCIDSILALTIYPNYEILIYSNGCDDGTVDYLNKLEKNKANVKIIISDSNDVYVEPNNRLIEMAQDNDVVLLNNDVEVHYEWLSHLCHTARLNESCGIVGAKVLYPNGRLQEYGSEIYADGAGTNIGKGDNPDQPEYNSIKSVPYVSGCCMYINRSTIAAIGILDIGYAPCYFEDSDYCYTAWKNDIMTLVNPKSVITHYEGASAGNDESSGFKKYQAINRGKFLSKHKEDIVAINKKAHSNHTLISTSL